MLCNQTVLQQAGNNSIIASPNVSYLSKRPIQTAPPLLFEFEIVIAFRQTFALATRMRPFARERVRVRGANAPSESTVHFPRIHAMSSA